MAVCHENSSSFFASRSSPTNFTFPPLGYPTQTNGYGQDYGQYGTMSQASYQQPPWAGMYGSTPRAAHPGLEDWTQNYTVPVTSSLQQPYNYAYRPPISSNMSVDYSQGMMGHGHSPLNGSPPLTSSSGEESPIISGISVSKGPYEWMKPAKIQPLNGKTRTKDKYRVVYTDHQRLELEKEFHFSKYITIRHKTQISTRLQLSERQVKIWFQNRRAKERKQKKGNDDDSSLSSKLEYKEPVSPPVNNVDIELHQDHQHHQHHSYQHHHHHQQPHYHSPSPVQSPPPCLPQLMVKREPSPVDSGTSILSSMSYQ